MSAQGAAQAQVNGAPLPRPALGTGYGAAGSQQSAEPGSSGTVPVMGAGLRSSEATVTVPQVPQDPQEILGSTVIGPAMPEVAKGGAPPPQEDASASSAAPRPQSSTENSGQPAEATAGSAGGEERVGISETEVPSADVEASFGYFTPRSLNSQFASAQAGRTAGGGSWHGWVSRLGELFTQPAIPNWLPSPIPSPPRPPSLLQRRSPWNLGRLQPKRRAAAVFLQRRYKRKCRDS